MYMTMADAPQIHPIQKRHLLISALMLPIVFDVRPTLNQNLVNVLFLIGYNGFKREMLYPTHNTVKVCNINIPRTNVT